MLLYPLHHFVVLMRRMAIRNQKHFSSCCLFEQLFQKRYKYPVVEVLFGNHKHQLTFAAQGRNHVEIKALTTFLDYRCFPSWCKAFACLVLGTHSYFICPEDNTTLLFSLLFDLRIALLNPMLHLGRALLIGNNGRLLVSKVPFAQQFGYIALVIAYPCFFL